MFRLVVLSILFGLISPITDASECPKAKSFEPSHNSLGTPLTPTDWSFGHDSCWEAKYPVCGGLRQSPMDLSSPTSTEFCSSSKIGRNGSLWEHAHYRRALNDPISKLSSHTGSLTANGDFGYLYLEEEGKEVKWEAVQVHFVSPSLHTIDGKVFDAEVVMYHRREGAKDFSQGAVALSMLVQDPNTTFNSSSDDANVDGYEVLDKLLKGPSYKYDGSFPVPPCHEAVKWIVLGQPAVFHLSVVLPRQRNGQTHREPKARNRCISVNSREIGGGHCDVTCTSKLADKWQTAAQCWKHQDTDHCWRQHYGSANIVTTAAADRPADEDIPQHSDFIFYKPVSNITISASLYSLDVFVAPYGNFGAMRLNGHMYFATNVSLKVISQHSIDGKFTAGELQIEHALYGTHTGSGHNNPNTEKVIVSIPLVLGSESALIRKLKLSSSAMRTLAEGRSYTTSTSFSLEDELDSIFRGDWYGYNAAKPGCSEYIRRVVFVKALEVSIEQFNLLSIVPVSGVDSTEMPAQQITEKLWHRYLPEKDDSNGERCEHAEGDHEWGYNDHCWKHNFPACGLKHQSPIDVPTGSIGQNGTDRFLSRCSWKPVAKLRVKSNGHALQVDSDQLGYLTLVGDDGFPAYYQAVQFHIHMPSEHLVGGKQYSAEVHVVHKRQNTVLDFDSEDILVTALFFDMTEDKVNPVLDQILRPNGTLMKGEIGHTLYMRRPFDLMRSFGPALDGNFYRYDGSFTTPPCTEGVKWFVFENALPMSRDQYFNFKAMYQNPANNRGVQPLFGRYVGKNELRQGKAKEFEFYLNRHAGRNRPETRPWLILFPVTGTVVLCVVIMIAMFVREDEGTKFESAGGLDDVPAGRAL